MDLEQLLTRLATGEPLTPEELGALSNEELGELEAGLRDEFTARVGTPDEPINDVSAQALDEAATLQSAIHQLWAQAGERYAEAEERATRARDLMSQVLVSDEPEEEEAPAEEPAPEQPISETDTPEAEPVAEEVTEPVAAAAEPRRTRAPISRIRAAQPPPPPSEPARTSPRVYAAPGLRSITAGAELSMEQAGEALFEMLDSVQGARSEGTWYAGRMEWGDQYGDDRQLTASASADQNTHVMERAVNNLAGYDDDGALTAAVGGLCGPVPIRFDLTTYTNTSRPVREALIGLNADRGGIQFMTAPTLASITVTNAQTTGAAVSRVTVANDASNSGAGVTKPVQDVDCGTLITEQVWAVPVRLNFSNFNDRYYPERGAAYLGLAMTAWARAAERYLLDAMRTAGGAGTQSSKVKVVNGGALDGLGAFRHYVRQVITACEHFRYNHRMDDSVALRAVVPDWLSAHLAIDLYNQAPGDNTIGMAIEGKREIERVLATENIRPIWQVDDFSANNADGAGGPAYSAVQATGALVDLPARVSTLIYPEGSFMFLDGGQLDFGVTIRDSTLNATNRYQSFFESFEGVAFTGPEMYDLTTLVCSNGTTGAPSTSIKCGGVGS